MKYFNVTISCSVTCDHCVTGIELLVLASKNSEIAAENG